MLSDDQKKIVIEEVQKHYDEQSQPFYLAELGQFFRTHDIAIPAGKRFKDFLAESFQDRLVVVQDPNVPARIAISIPDKKAQVQGQLADRFPVTPSGPPMEVNRLPFSLIAAFCQKPSAGLRVFYRVTRPGRYFIGLTAPDDTYIEISDDLRIPLPEGMSLHEVTGEIRQGIYRRIAEWSKTQNVSLEAVYVVERGRTSVDTRNRHVPLSNALTRLIEAQEPEFRKKINVPGDIALTLMNIE